MKNLITNYEKTREERESSPATVSELSRQAYEKVNSNNWPSRSDEKWKYTKLSHLKKDEFVWLGPPAKSACEAYLKSVSNVHNTIYFFDGHFIEGVSDSFIDKSLVNFVNSKKPEFVSLYSKFSDNKGLDNGVLRDLNLAYNFNPGVLQINKGEAPINLNICFVDLNRSDDLNFITPSLNILLAKEAEADIQIDLMVSYTSFTNALVDVYLEEFAKLSICSSVKPENKQSIIVSSKTYLQANSQLHSATLLQGGKLNRFEEEIIVQGVNTSLHSKLAYIAEMDEQIDIRSVVNHLAPEGDSFQLIKGQAKDKASVSVNGRIYISQDSQKVNSGFTNHNLLLSEFAEINTKPELEVEADDVKAGHGATVGQIEEEELFYLISRGINPEEAKNLLIKGYIYDVFADSGLSKKSIIYKQLEDYFAATNN